jgi:hypothetical protein
MGGSSSSSALAYTPSGKPLGFSGYSASSDHGTDKSPHTEVIVLLKLNVIL